MSNKLNRLFRWIFKPNTTIKLSTLKRNWYHDTPNLILHANMKLLEDFIKNEISLDIVDWEADSKCAIAYATFMEIHVWWNTDPLARDYSLLDSFYETDRDYLLGIKTMDPWRIRSKLLASCYGESYAFWFKELIAIPQDTTCESLVLKIESLAKARQNEMLKRLIDVRDFLWA